MDSHADTEKHLTVGPAVRTWPMSWLNNGGRSAQPASYVTTENRSAQGTLQC